MRNYLKLFVFAKEPLLNHHSSNLVECHKDYQDIIATSILKPFSCFWLSALFLATSAVSNWFKLFFGNLEPVLIRLTSQETRQYQTDHLCHFYFRAIYSRFVCHLAL